jgi:hypothetical protein
MPYARERSDLLKVGQAHGGSVASIPVDTRERPT